MDVRPAFRLFFCTVEPPAFSLANSEAKALQDPKHGSGATGDAAGSGNVLLPHMLHLWPTCAKACLSSVAL